MRVLRVVGWTLIAAGVVALLYVAYALWFTGFETERAQQALRQDWQQEVGVVEPSEPADSDAGSANPGAPPSDHGRGQPQLAGQRDAVAMLEFVRPGSEQPPVREGPLFVVSDVGYEDLTRGPGHYPGTELPGEGGNFAVAGHRTTYDAPFYSLNELRTGDEIHVTDRSGTRYVYEFAERRIVQPSARWVLGDDPLDTPRPTLTLTTCHPRFSAAQRMVVFAELAG